MQGDKILIEAHHRRAAQKIVKALISTISETTDRYTISVAGESGSGKSETAAAIAEALEEQGIRSLILQQDDYYMHPPKTNDRMRRQESSWRGMQEVRLALLDRNLQEFLDGAVTLEKPLALYEEDRIDTETLDMRDIRVAIAEGTYTTTLTYAKTHVFIDRNYLDTRAHREKRGRNTAELDAFTEGILKIEHEIVSAHKANADIVITKDYDVLFES